MTLKTYAKKRDFKKTPEPKPEKGHAGRALTFSVQKHAARRLHYDLRLEYKGVLLSWAIPKGPSMDPNNKRLAIQTEDHPLEYRYFEGEIPRGEYGAGTVEVWDRGTYEAKEGASKNESEKLIGEGLNKGHLQFILHGDRLNGTFDLIHIKTADKDNSWLMVKKKDVYADDSNPSLQSNEKEAKPAKSKKSAPSKQLKIGRSLKGLKLTHLDKLYWKKDGITKGDMIHYYESIAPYILPYLKNRPLMIRRFPEGIDEDYFVQKEAPQNAPEFVKTVEIDHEGKAVHYMVVENVKSLLYVANLGSIELHPFNSSLKHLHNPDYTVLDLDPEDLSFDKVIEVAQEVHGVLEEIGVPNFCKTSGARGIHIYIPLQGKYDFDQARDFALLVANAVHKRIPNITSLERSPKSRQKKVYLDFLQNRWAQTLVCAYSLRGKPGATVSTPLEWDELEKGISPGEFTIRNMLERVKEKGDPFKPVLRLKANLSASLKKLEKLL